MVRMCIIMVFVHDVSPWDSLTVDLISDLVLGNHGHKYNNYYVQLHVHISLSLSLSLDLEVVLWGGVSHSGSVTWQRGSSWALVAAQPAVGVALKTSY